MRLLITELAERRIMATTKPAVIIHAKTTMMFVLICRSAGVRNAEDEMRAWQWLEATVIYHRRKLAAVDGRRSAGTVATPLYWETDWYPMRDVQRDHLVRCEMFNVRW